MITESTTLIVERADQQRLEQMLANRKYILAHNIDQIQRLRHFVEEDNEIIRHIEDEIKKRKRGG